MNRYLPIVLGAIAIVGLTIPQIKMSDRFAGNNYTAEQRAELLKKIPKKIGDWQGEDMEIDPTVRETAGAVGAVSRIYRNSRTGDKVDLWLIVGHGRVISAHTPNICYRASGFEMRAPENSLYPMVFPGQREAPFWTNTFFKEDLLTKRTMVRVFWSWYNTENEDHKGEVVWEAPPNARWYFGNTRALYKMYFTSQMKDPLETAEQSACLRFAREFLPVVNEALAVVHLQKPGATDDVAEPADEAGEVAAVETTEAPAETTVEDAEPVDATDLFSEEAPATTEESPSNAAAPN
jgi:hypothetical protein